jgi:hypothetical protein
MAHVLTETRDSNWIATKALTRLGEVSVDNPPSSEDLNLALDQLDATYLDLQARGVCYIPDLDVTPSAYATWIAERVAIDLKADYGYQAPDGQAALKPLSMVETALRRLSADEPSYGPQKVEFS